MVELHHLFENQFGDAEWVLEAPLPTKGVAVIDNVASPPTLTYTANPSESGVDVIKVRGTITETMATDILLVPVTIGLCIDCFGILDGTARLDECGVCNGTNSTCLGCDDVPNSGSEIDFCGICAGDNSTCVNITVPPIELVSCFAVHFFQLQHEPADTPVVWDILLGPFKGDAFVNHISGFIEYMNPAVAGMDWLIIKATSQLNNSIMDTANITFLLQDCPDCAGNQLGLQLFDICGVCGGDSSTCRDCFGIPNGGNVFDVCGVCGGDGSSCLDCFGVPFGPAVLDMCGVCAGDGSSCDEDADILPITIVGIVLLFGLLCFLIFVCIVVYRYCILVRHVDYTEASKNYRGPEPITSAKVKRFPFYISKTPYHGAGAIQRIRKN